MSIKTGRVVVLILMWIFVGAGVILMVTPCVWMALSSLKTRAEVFSIPLTLFPAVLQWDNYVNVAGQMRFVRVFGNSMIVATALTAINVLSGTWGGYTFGKLRWPGRDKVFVFLLSTMMIPGFVLVLPRYLIIAQAGLINTYLGLIIPFVVSSFSIFLARQYLLGIPDELLDAAKVDGASAFSVYWRIIVPLCKPIMGVVAILTFLWSWDELLWPVMVLTEREMWTMPIAITTLRIQATGSALNEGAELQMAGATLAVIPILVAFVIFQRSIVQSVAMSGIKG